MWMWIAMALAGTLSGTAHDAKLGAAVVDADGEVTYILGLKSWPVGVPGTPVKLLGKDVAREVPAAVRSPAGEVSQGIKSTEATPPSFAPSAWAPSEPWHAQVADGSGNVTTVWTEGATVRWRYTPVTPEQSSSGTYSGGQPAYGHIRPDQAAPILALLEAAERKPHIEARRMGSFRVRLQRWSGDTTFLIARLDGWADASATLHDLQR